MDPTHAPGWRARPRRIGPIEATEEPSRLAAFCYATSAALAALTLIGAALVWIADVAAGHVHL